MSDVFVKRDPAPLEAAGLRWLADAGARVPQIVSESPRQLKLHRIEHGQLDAAGEAELGRMLATTHAAGAARFGSLPASGRFFVGRCELDSPEADDWNEYYLHHRCLPLARRVGLEREVAAVRVDAPVEPVARLHGDLWSGNVLADPKGRPWLIDPAAYGGHREVDLAMLDLFGAIPERTDYQLASPCLVVDIPQTYLEPILVRRATERGTITRFSTEYIGHTQDDEGVDATVRDRVTGEQYTIRAKYLIGADGARSIVADEIGLPLEGAMDVAGSMNITFTADIAELVEHRPSVLYWVIQPGSNVGGIGAGLVRMVRPWNEWLIVWGYDIAQPSPEVDEAAAVQIVRNLLGVPDLDVEITGTSLWGNNEMYATGLQAGRVFCAGDAIHRHPPSNGLGSNTSVQDAYNLAWKLALVLRGRAAPSLLDTYTAERAPVAKRIVQRANRSAREFAGLFDALGIEAGQSADEMAAQIEERKAPTAAGARKRTALVEAMELKHYEFNAHGVDLGQFYESSAIVGDGSVRPPFERDPDLYYQVSTVPGSRLPHAWMGDSKSKVSTLDLAGYDRFTVFTGITGEPWSDAAASVADELGVPVSVVVIGPGRDVQDLYFDWARLREVDEDGALLVRPDKHIAWRAVSLPDDPAGELGAALRAVLGR